MSKFALESGSLAELYGHMSDGRMTVLTSQAGKLEFCLLFALLLRSCPLPHEQRLAVSGPTSREER